MEENLTARTPTAQNTDFLVLFKKTYLPETPFPPKHDFEITTFNLGCD